MVCFLFEQKTAYELRISDWSSDVCSSDLRAGEEEVADEHRGAVAPDDVRGLPPAAQVGTVDDVVVEQGRGVDELDRGGKLAVAAARIVEKLRRGERQHRPHPFAPAGDQLAGAFGGVGRRSCRERGCPYV